MTLSAPITCWIQHADFLSDDLGAVDETEAIQRFRAHDWREENRKYDEFQTEGQDCCPPGIGFVSEFGILHLCPNAEGQLHCFYHFKQPRTFLKVFSSLADASRMADALPHERSTDLIRAFFRNDRATLLRLLPHES
jgi:hypothetical protein